MINAHTENPNGGLHFFESKINKVIDHYMPLGKLTKKEIYHQNKPWITRGIKQSMIRRDKLYKRFIKEKDDEIKNVYNKQYKDLRNKIVSLCMQSRKNYHQKYFAENANNLKNTWNGIKAIININDKRQFTPASLLVENEILSDPRTQEQLFFINCRQITGKNISHIPRF